MPGLWSSPVCLTVVWFLSWSLHSGCAQIWTDEVSGVQYGRLGSNVTLTCGKSQFRIPVVWHLNHSSVLPWHQVMPDGRLVLLHADLLAQGDYSCSDNRGLLLHSVRLRLGHPPGKLTISCLVPNHTYVRCSWVDSVKTFLPASYNATIMSGRDWAPCIVDVARRCCDVDHPSFWVPVHVIGITETNGLGSETTFTNVRLHHLLKPDPPELVFVKELEGNPQKLQVSWNIPSSWPLDGPYPLLFNIRYRPQGSKFWSEVYTENNKVVIADALAGHMHQVQVRARDEVNSESQWSEWTPQFLAKPWEAYTTPESTDWPDDTFPDYGLPDYTQPETSTAESHKSLCEDEGSLGLVILLVLFSVVIVTTILSVVFVVWMRQRRRDNASKQELASMVKMKSVPI
ncbi:interleukin-11 receptor subunit alpha [Pholidichthys leucotaenia]